MADTPIIGSIDERFRPQLAAGFEPKYGLSARTIAAVLEGLEGARREDGVPARVVVREGDARRAEDL